jgi:hypothetical protein
MPCNMEEVGIRVYRMLSSPITTAIKKSWRWHGLRCCMVVGVELRCFGVRLENGRCLGLTFCKKPRSKFVWLGRTCELRNQGRRATSQACTEVSPMRGLHRLKIRGKLAPRFIGPLKILEKRGEVAFQFELSPQLSDMHDVFHVS